MNLEVIDSLKRIGRIQTYNNNDVIFLEGDVADCFYIILKGSVQISKKNIFDGKVIGLSRLTQGIIFGELSFLSNEKRSASAIVKEQSSIIEVPYDSFEEFILLNPMLSIKLLETLIKRHERNLKLIGESEYEWSKIY